MPHRFPPLADPNLLPRKVAIVAPHPDDEVLGCGGMLAFHAERGDDPTVIFLSDGAEGDPTGTSHDLAAIRRRESTAALAELGVRRVEHWGFPDGRLEEAHELPGRIVGILEHLGAQAIYVPSLLECHADHLAAAEAAAQALAADPNVLVLWYGVNTAVPANRLYDVSRYRAKKDAALRRYESQMKYMDLVRASRAMDAARTVNIPDPKITDCEGYCAVTGAELLEGGARLRLLRDWLVPPAGDGA